MTVCHDRHVDRPTLLRGVFARYAAVVVGATALLIIAPVSISEKITLPQLALLARSGSR